MEYWFARPAALALMAALAAAVPSFAAGLDEYRAARALLEDGAAEEAIERLEKLAVPSFILGDYAMRDLASVLKGKEGLTASLPALDRLVKNFPKSPLAATVNKLRLLAACGDVSSETCGGYLESIGVEAVPAEFRAKRIYMEARRMEPLGRKAAAYRLYQRAYYDYPDPAIDREIIEKTIRLRREEGAPPGKSAYPYATFSQRMGRAERLYRAFRYSDAAVELERILKIGYSESRKAKALYKLGMVKYRARDRTGARAVFKEVIRRYAGSGLAHMADYRIAVIDWNNDKNAQTAQRLKKLASSGAGRQVRARARYVLGRIAESAGRLGEAGEEYAAALELSPDPRLARDIMWRIGWTKYQEGGHAQAARLFEKFSRDPRNTGADGKFLYWAARAKARAGDAAGGERMGEKLKGRFPHTYYGTRMLTGPPDPRPVNGVMSLKPDESGRMEPVGVALDEEAERRRRRFEALVEMEMYGEARLELDALSRRLTRSPEEALWLALQYRRARAPGRSIRLVANHGGPLDLDFSGPSWRAYYPVEHWENVAGQARTHGVSPFLALAIIRQESAFEPAALSPADARGLMQIIPATGRRVYENTGMPEKTGKPFAPRLLFNPNVNIPLGVAYFSGLLARYEGNLTLALAAYNAGESAADKWRERYGNLDDDELVEMIPYSETRDYVKKVKRNLALYRLIYTGGVDREKTAPSSDIARQGDRCSTC
ncbi:MAG: transglycosylase SLT domain-containing protein [Candidatus Nitrospinota bacterium M3_3B_026]